MILKINALSLILASGLLLGLAGCAKDEHGGGNSGEGGGENLPVFNFSTKATYTLNLQYQVPSGYRVYFEVYAENPFSADQVKKTDLEPIDKGYTDDKGKYSSTIIVPAAVETLYIYTPNAGVPSLLTATAKDGILSEATVPTASANGAKSANGFDFVSPNTVTSCNKVDFPGIQTILLGSWTHSDNLVSVPGVDQSVLWGGNARLWGRPDYLSFVNQQSFPDASKGKALDIDAAIWNTINTVLPGEGHGEVNPDVLQNGDIRVTQDAEVDLYLLDEQCLNLNVLAYYCYPTGQAPTSPADIKAQVIALPDAKMIRYHFTPYLGTGVTNYGAMLPGEGIRLHYIDENGVNQGTKFPAGTSIGWVLYSNGYKMKYETNSVVGVYETGVPQKGDGAVYSDPKLMGGLPHVAVFRHGDFVITSFEDGVKTSASDMRDYKDVIFHVASTPAGAITPGIPDKDPNAPDDKTVVFESKYRGILSFEDNWPYRGDFDMNDVVIKYVSTVGYNIKNEVLETTDVFTVMWSGATYNNSFAYQNANLSSVGATVTFEGGDGTTTYDAQQQVVRLASNVLDYANLPDKKVFTVKTKYTNPINRQNFVWAPYNPFIAIKGDKTKEAHLVNHTPTSYANMSLFGFGHDKSQPDKGLYYITYDDNGNQMPFAIDLRFESQKQMDTYVIPAENKPIHVHYPDFLKWIKSQGRDYKNWYLHPQGR